MAVVPEFRCVYCGNAAMRDGSVACRKHRDLPALDPGAPASTRELRDWWLERYGLDEIRDLAAGLVAA